MNTKTNRKTEAQQYVDGDAPLPATFTTGFKRDLEVAREMIKLRQQPGDDEVTETPESTTLDEVRRCG